MSETLTPAKRQSKQRPDVMAPKKLTPAQLEAKRDEIRIGFNSVADLLDNLLDELTGRWEGVLKDADVHRMHHDLADAVNNIRDAVVNHVERPHTSTPEALQRLNRILGGKEAVANRM